MVSIFQPSRLIYIFRTCVWRPRLRSLPRGHEEVKRSRRRQTHHGQRREGKKRRRLRATCLRAIVVEAAVALTLGPSVRAYVRETNREVRRREAAVPREFVASKRCERNDATLYTELAESRFSRVWGRGSVLPVKMRSPAACYTRRLRGATFDKDEDEPSIVALSFSEANSTTCHCHCPSSSRDAFGKDDGTLTTPTAACDLCERLRGKTGGCYDPAEAIWTGDSHHVADRPSRQKRDKNDPLANDSEPVVEKRDRTLRCDRTSLRESSARCASSVVRWIFAVRFHGDFKSTEWRSLLWIVLLILAMPDLAAARSTPTPKDGGEYALFFLPLGILSICVFDWSLACVFFLRNLIT